MTNRSRRGLIAILALSMVWALPLWLVTFPPMTDYPQHLAMASIVRFFSDPVRNLAGTYQVAPLHPNTAFELLVASIAGLVDINVAGKLVVMLALVAVCPAA